MTKMNPLDLTNPIYGQLGVDGKSSHQPSFQVFELVVPIQGFTVDLKAMLLPAGELKTEYLSVGSNVAEVFQAPPLYGTENSTLDHKITTFTASKIIQPVIWRSAYLWIEPK
jgi:hypothetical protein